MLGSSGGQTETKAVARTQGEDSRVTFRPA